MQLWACNWFVYVVVFLIAFVIGDSVCAEDWPQWRGPRRDAVCVETGLLQTWPEGGPKIKWQAPGFGTGYSSLAVASGRLFTLGRKETDVIVTACEVATGKPIWVRKIGQTTRHLSSTPTLDGDRVYALDPDGDLVAMQASTGEVAWTRNFVDDFAGRMMSGRGYGESPLIDGDRLICTPGGPDADMVALDKHTGNTIWKAKIPELGPHGRDGAGFSSIVVTEAAGIRQYVQLVGRGLVGIDARDGRFLWGHNDIANGTANIPTPVVDSEFVFAANGYSAGCVLFRPVAEKSFEGLPGVRAELIYSLSASQFQNHHGGMVRVGDFLYAGHGNNNGLPTCIEFKTGRVVWKRRGPGIGSAAIVYADGHLYFRYQNGLVALIEASPDGYKLKGTLQIRGAGGDSWAHPVIANGILYLREQNTVWAYDLRKESIATERAATTSDQTSNAPADVIQKLESLRVSLEKFLVVGQPTRRKTTAEIGRRSYKYAMSELSNTAAESTIIVTFSDHHLALPGLLPEELIGLLKQLPGPLIVSLAGTQISDRGLAQLQQLKVVGLNLELCSRVTDAGLMHLAQIESLRELVLAGTSVTQSGLRHLITNSHLLALDLELCDYVTDDACELLGEIQQLRSLVLKKSGFERHRITDVGLRRLHRLSKLEVLNLYGNSISDAGLVHLQELKQLRELNLSLLPITDAGLTQLQRLTELERLELLYSEGFAGPKLTNEIVEHIQPLSNLKTLNLTGANLTDYGLERLRGLVNLKSLQLVRTNVSENGIREFRRAVPNCEVNR